MRSDISLLFLNIQKRKKKHFAIQSAERHRKTSEKKLL